MLCSPDGQLMEGLSSNFFVLQGGALLTADEGVLGGTIREIVLQVRFGSRILQLPRNLMCHRLQAAHLCWHAHTQC